MIVPQSPTPSPDIRYRRAPRPLRFPAEEQVPETKRHFLARTLLFQVLKRAVDARSSVGSDQFVYWNAADPRVCVAPDAFVRLGVPDEDFRSWKVWQKGAPELAVEIISRDDARDAAWEEKVVRYHEMGVQELVRFDEEAESADRLRVWDRVEGDLVERLIDPPGVTPCRVLGLYWVVAPLEGDPAVLRLARDAAGRDWIATPDEGEAAATQRIAELEAELHNRRG